MTPGRAKSAKAVGRYKLVYELGQSYLGPLWAVRAEGMGGAAQLGTLRLVSLAGLSADTRVRLLEAAWQAMEVRGDFVSPVTDVVASDGELGVVSDYGEGVTLRALANVASVRRKPVPFGVALRIVLDVLDATAALHQASIELGDEAVPLFGGLSADSILVCTSGRSVVIDAAIASAASEIESLGGTAERVAYAAPEQLASPPATGSAVADARTDVFAVGILAWELFSGRRLFIGSDKTLAQKVLTAKIPKLDEARRKGDPEIPAAVQSAVMKALDRNPARRFQSAAEFAEALAVSAGHGTAAADVSEYVTMVAEGPLTRVREALQNAESGTHEAVAPLSVRAARTSAMPKRSSKRPSAAPAPAPDASPQSVPWAKLSPARAKEPSRTRSVPVRPAAGPGPALAASAVSSQSAAAAVEAQSAAAATPAVPPVQTPVQAVEMAPTPVATTEVARKVDAPPKAAIPGPKRPSGANKISLPRSPGTPAGSRASAKRPTLQGGWALTQAAIDELAGARTAPAPQAAPPAPDPGPAKVPQKPMVKVGAASSFGAKAGGGPSATDTLQAYPSVPPAPLGGRQRQATMIGIPLPASPSSPDIDLSKETGPEEQRNRQETQEDEQTRVFVSPPPSATRTTEPKAEPKAPEPVKAAPAPRFDTRLVRPGTRAATSPRTRAPVDAVGPVVPPASDGETTTVFAARASAPLDLEAMSAASESDGAKTSLLEDDEEQTHQYNPTDLLLQVEAMGHAGESGLLRPVRQPVPNDAPIGRHEPEATIPDVIPDVSFAPIAPPDVPRQEPRDQEDRETVTGSPALAPMSPLSMDGGYLDEPDASSAFESTLKSHVEERDSDLIDELLGKPVALSPPQPPEPRPSPVPAEGRAAPLPSGAITSRNSPTEKFAGFPAPTSMIPSQVPPPLIHDPRANRQATGGRTAVAVAAPKPGGARWVVVALLSVIVLCASAGVSLYVLRGRNAAASRDVTAAPAPTTAVVEATPKPEPAPAAEPAPAVAAEPVPSAAEPAAAASAASAAPENAPPPADSAEPAASASAAAPAEGEAADPLPAPVAAAATPAPAPAKAAAPAPAKAPAPAARAPAPVKAAAPAAPKRPAPPKKKNRNVPDDI